MRAKASPPTGVAWLLGLLVLSGVQIGWTVRTGALAGAAPQSAVGERGRARRDRLGYTAS